MIHVATMWAFGHSFSTRLTTGQRHHRYAPPAAVDGTCSCSSNSSSRRVACSPLIRFRNIFPLYFFSYYCTRRGRDFRT